MDRRSLSLSNRSFAYYFITLLLIFSFTIAAPSAMPVEEDESSSSRVSRPTPTPDSDSDSSPSYTPSSTRRSSQPTADPETAPVPDMPLPRAFDTTVLSMNFTSSGCQPFFDNFLNNVTFINCLPMSFFLQNSKSWFDITKEGLIPVTRALDQMCNVDSNVCNAVMNDFGRKLLEVDNCGADFKARNPIILQAYASFLTYPVLYAAGCQRSETGYCYADAITNSTNAADTYVYLMPLGVPIPGGARLTCSTCLQKIMRIYSVAASNKSLPLSSTYIPGANLINLGCGPGFTNTTIAEAQIGSGISLYQAGSWIPTVSIIAIMSMLFL